MISHPVYYMQLDSECVALNGLCAVAINIISMNSSSICLILLNIFTYKTVIKLQL